MRPKESKDVFGLVEGAGHGVVVGVDLAELFDGLAEIAVPALFRAGLVSDFLDAAGEVALPSACLAGVPYS